MAQVRADQDQRPAVATDGFENLGHGARIRPPDQERNNRQLLEDDLKERELDLQRVVPGLGGLMDLDLGKL